jgi:hypothetical protein
LGVTEEIQHSKVVSSLRDEIEFEVRQWYAGDYGARECAERILRLLEDRREEEREPASHVG